MAGPTLGLVDAATQAELTALYSAPDRHYHGMAHVRALLALAAEFHDRLADPEAVEAAIWFHDAIYDSRAKDNEAKSAALAVERLTGRVGASAAGPHRGHHRGDSDASRARPARRGSPSRCSAHAGHGFSGPRRTSGSVRRLRGAGAQGICLVPQDAWRNGRMAVLKGFLQRERDFDTPEFRARCEAQARDNMARSVQRLARG